LNPIRQPAKNVKRYEEYKVKNNSKIFFLLIENFFFQKMISLH